MGVGFSWFSWFQLIHNPEGFIQTVSLLDMDQGWDGTLQRMYSFGEGEQPDAHWALGWRCGVRSCGFYYFDIFWPTDMSIYPVKCGPRRRRMKQCHEFSQNGAFGAMDDNIYIYIYMIPSNIIQVHCFMRNMMMRPQWIWIRGSVIRKDKDTNRQHFACHWLMGYHHSHF